MSVCTVVTMVAVMAMVVEVLTREVVVLMVAWRMIVALDMVVLVVVSAFYMLVWKVLHQ